VPASPHRGPSKSMPPRMSARSLTPVVAAVLASLLMVAPAWGQSSSVMAYGGGGGIPETVVGPAVAPVAPVAPGAPGAPARSVLAGAPGEPGEPVAPGAPGEPGEPGTPGEDVAPVAPAAPGAPGVSPPAATVHVAQATDRGLLSLPRTGFTIALLVAAGLLLTGAGIATRRVAGGVERGA